MTHNEWSAVPNHTASTVPGLSNTAAFAWKYSSSHCRNLGISVGAAGLKQFLLKEQQCAGRFRNWIFMAAKLVLVKKRQNSLMQTHNYRLSFILVSVFQASDLCQCKVFVVCVVFPPFKHKKVFFTWDVSWKVCDLAQCNEFSTVEGQLVSGHITSQQHGTEDMSRQGYDNMNWQMRAVAKKSANYIK